MARGEERTGAVAVPAVPVTAGEKDEAEDGDADSFQSSPLKPPFSLLLRAFVQTDLRYSSIFFFNSLKAIYTAGLRYGL